MSPMRVHLLRRKFRARRCRRLADILLFGSPRENTNISTRLVRRGVSDNYIFEIFKTPRSWRITVSTRTLRGRMNYSVGKLNICSVSVTAVHFSAGREFGNYRASSVVFRAMFRAPHARRKVNDKFRNRDIRVIITRAIHPHAYL